MAWIRIAIEASEASAPNTRMWPTRATSFGASVEPREKAYVIA
jgi:hypothetical protein